MGTRTWYREMSFSELEEVLQQFDALLGSGYTASESEINSMLDAQEYLNKFSD